MERWLVSENRDAHRAGAHVSEAALMEFIAACSAVKAAADALTLQVRKVNLFEFPECKENLTDFLESKTWVAP